MERQTTRQQSFVEVKVLEKQSAHQTLFCWNLEGRKVNVLNK
jgi:hypothetical protein